MRCRRGRKWRKSCGALKEPLRVGSRLEPLHLPDVVRTSDLNARCGRSVPRPGPRLRNATAGEIEPEWHRSQPWMVKEATASRSVAGNPAATRPADPKFSTVPKHGLRSHSRWRKRHLGVAADTRRIVAAELTPDKAGDASAVPESLDPAWSTRFANSDRNIPAMPRHPEFLSDPASEEHGPSAD